MTRNRRFHLFSDKQLSVGLFGAAVLLFLFIGAPLITSVDPRYFGAYMLSAPGENGHILGSTQLGQDVYTMIVFGARTSLMVALGASLLSSLFGVIVGGIGGFFGGGVDRIIREIINAFMMLPHLFLILLIVAFFGNNMFNIMIAIAIATWPSNAMLMRAQALSIKERTYVHAGEAIGESKLQILVRYIIPNGIFPVIANTTAHIGQAILAEAGLAFLGLGDPTVISWGQMIQAGRPLITSAWWVTVFPGLAIVFTVMTFFLLGDGLSHLFNPKQTAGGDH